MRPCVSAIAAADRDIALRLTTTVRKAPILDDTSFPSSFFSCEGEVYELWKGVRAVGEGRFAVAPALMHSILGSAVFAQSIGMLWIVRVVAPSRFKYDIVSEMKGFYRLFYGLDRDDRYIVQLVGMGPRMNGQKLSYRKPGLQYWTAGDLDPSLHHPPAG